MTEENLLAGDELVDPALDQPMDSRRIRFEVVRIRVAAAQEAQKRSRLAFMGITFVSLLVIIGAWNAYFSWHRFLLLSPSPISNTSTDLGPVISSTPEEVVKAATEEMPNHDITYYARQQVIAEWATSQIISLPIIGVRIAVSDAAVVGSLILLFIVTLFTLSMRRENRTIGKLLRSTRTSEKEIQDFVFHGIAQHMLLTDLGESESPITRLESDREEKPPRLRLRNTFKILMFLPAIAVGFVVFCDIYTIVKLPAALRYTHEPLFRVILDDMDTWLLVAVYELSALLVLFLIVAMSKKALAFEQGTGAILREYGKIALKGTAISTNSSTDVVA